MSTEFSETAPYVLIGIGVLIILIGALACCCTVKGQPTLLYIVSITILQIICTNKTLLRQYGAFLAIVFALELGAGISTFAYRTKLMAGFDKGLTQGMINYRNNTGNIADDFDLVQQTVNETQKKLSCKFIVNKFFILVALLWKSWPLRLEGSYPTNGSTPILLRRWQRV